MSLDQTIATLADMLQDERQAVDPYERVRLARVRARWTEERILHHLQGDLWAKARQLADSQAVGADRELVGGRS